MKRTECSLMDPMSLPDGIPNSFSYVIPPLQIDISLIKYVTLFARDLIDYAYNLLADPYRIEFRLFPFQRLLS